MAVEHGVPADSPVLASLASLALLARLAADAPSVRRTEALSDFSSPDQHLSQAGRGEQRREVSREGRLPTP